MKTKPAPARALRMTAVVLLLLTACAQGSPPAEPQPPAPHHQTPGQTAPQVTVDADAGIGVHFAPDSSWVVATPAEPEPPAPSAAAHGGQSPAPARVTGQSEPDPDRAGWSQVDARTSSARATDLDEVAIGPGTGLVRGSVQAWKGTTPAPNLPFYTTLARWPSGVRETVARNITGTETITVHLAATPATGDDRCKLTASSAPPSPRWEGSSGNIARATGSIEPTTRASATQVATGTSALVAQNHTRTYTLQAPVEGQVEVRLATKATACTSVGGSRDETTGGVYLCTEDIIDASGSTITQQLTVTSAAGTFTHTAPAHHISEQVHHDTVTATMSAEVEGQVSVQVDTTITGAPAVLHVPGSSLTLSAR